MTDRRMDPVAPFQSNDAWAPRRIWIAGASGASLVAGTSTLDFWPLPPGNTPENAVRAAFDFWLFVACVPLVLFAAGLLIASVFALLRGQFRRMASSSLAIAAIPLMIVVANAPPFDPWFWYAVANRARFETLATRGPAQSGPKYAVLEIDDVSTGLAGLNPSHFVALVYDETDAVAVEPSRRPATVAVRSLWSAVGSMPVPKGARIYGHILKVDVFE